MQTKTRTASSLGMFDLLKGVGMQLVSTVGGASGPLYGTAFMKAGMACKGLTELDGPAFIKAMEAAVDGIKMRGKATEGEKTMLDALCPALKVMQDEVAAGKSLKEAFETEPGLIGTLFV